jgi:hypothetical protein
MTRRNRRIEIRLSDEELAQAEALAAEHNLTVSDLFRCSTLKRRLPRRVTQVAGQSYWELIKIETSLSQLIEAIDIAQSRGEPIERYLHSIEEIKDLVIRLRRDLVN